MYMCSELFDNLNTVVCSTLASYLVWTAVNTQVGYFTNSFVEASFLLSQAESGVHAVDPRWQRCVSKVNAAFGYATSALYVQDYFAKESKSKVGNTEPNCSSLSKNSVCRVFMPPRSKIVGHIVVVLSLILSLRHSVILSFSLKH